MTERLCRAAKQINIIKRINIMKRNVLGFMTLLVVVLFASCAKYPEAEVAAAKSALDSARIAGADLYVAEEFNAVVDSFNVATLLVEEQKGKFMANYDGAIVKFTEVTERANALVTQASDRKEAVKQQAMASISQLDALVKEDLALLEQAPKGKEGAAALEAVKSELTVIESAVVEANSLVENGDYISASDKANAAYEKALLINEELKAAIERSTKRR
jgi:hypothetical protein